MKRKHLYPILVILVTVALYFGEQYVNKATEYYPNTSNTKPENSSYGVSLLPSSNGEIVEHAYYTLSYREEHEQAEWVAYELKEKHIKSNDFKRPYFVEDRKVKTKSAHWRNYKGSGYDRGHLLPAGDRGFDYDAYHETFLTSNISPQNHDFNSGIWNDLEQKVRYWAGRYEDVYVITGGVLKKGLQGIGTEDVSIPEAFYKIVYDKRGDEHKVIAFLIPHKPLNDSFYNYVTTVDAIEEATNIDFFPELADSVESKLEASKDLNFWK